MGALNVVQLEPRQEITNHPYPHMNDFDHYIMIVEPTICDLGDDIRSQ
jgi:hypothetical protein